LVQIVTIGPIQESDYTLLLQGLSKKTIQALFAEIAAIFWVGNKVIPSEWLYIDDPLLDRSCRITMTFRPGVDTLPLLLFLKAGAGMEHQNPVCPQSVKGGAQQKRGVDSAGKGYSHSVEPGEKTAELLDFTFQLCYFSGSKEKSALGK
jgi:hypothetical protein